MARPRLGESDTERLHMKITAKELAAIDDWRFSNRVPSRSEAVRRLCSVAIVALSGLDKLKRMAENASVRALDDHEHIGGLFRGLLTDAADGNERGFTYEEAKDLLHDVSDRAYWQEQHSRYLNRIIAGLCAATDMFADPQSFAAAERNARERLEELDAFIELQHNSLELLTASHARSSVFRSMTDAERSHLDSLEDHEERIDYLDQKVAKYLASRRRRDKRLRDKLRKEDEQIRLKAQAIFRQEINIDNSDEADEEAR